MTTEGTNANHPSSTSTKETTHHTENKMEHDYGPLSLVISLVGTYGRSDFNSDLQSSPPSIEKKKE